jgi:hypothetical protein
VKCDASFGSKEHRSCKRRLCTNCAGEHDVMDCEADDVEKCFYCGGNHQASRCSVRCQQREAIQRKKESYADILKKSSSEMVPPPNISSSRSQCHYAFINAPTSPPPHPQPQHIAPPAQNNCFSIAGHAVDKVAVKAIIEIVCVIFQLDVSKILNVLSALESSASSPNNASSVLNSSSSSQTADVSMIESVTNTLDMEVSTSSEQVTSVVNDTAMDDATSSQLHRDRRNIHE